VDLSRLNSILLQTFLVVAEPAKSRKRLGGYFSHSRLLVVTFED